MKKIFNIRYATLLIALITAATSSFTLEARQLSPARAWQTALTHDALTPDRIIKSRHTASTPRLLATETAEGLNTVYIMESQSDSTIYFISADDVAVPLLGYCDSKGFNADSMPDNLRWWLSQYSAEITSAADNDRPITRSNIDFGLSDIAPLLTTNWNQGDPYNMLCPTVDGKRTYTGCVATAMAMVMNHHRHPERGTGSISYDWGGTELSMNFSQFTPDWDNMLPSYDNGEATDAQKEAVAGLMQACGHSVYMDYGLSASGAASFYVALALPEYFGYARDLRILTRNHFPLGEWCRMLHDDLTAGRPIYYSGSNQSSGHAFVIDGYRRSGNLFHVNWGWGGMSNGYFVISSLDPASQGIGGSAAGYNISQQAILGVRPDDGTTDYIPVFYSVGGMNSDKTTYSRSETIELKRDDNGYFVGSNSVATVTVAFGVRITDIATGEAYDAFDQSSEWDLPPGYGYLSVYLNASELPEQGTARLELIAKSGGRIYPVYAPFAGITSMIAECTPEQITLRPETKNVTVHADNIDILTPPYVDRAMEFTAEITCQGEEYLGEVYPIIRKNSFISYKLSGISIDLLDGDTQTYHFKPDIRIAEDDYSLVICDAAGREISEPVPVTIKHAATNSYSLRVESMTCSSGLGTGTYADPFVVDPADASFDMTVANDEGFYSNIIGAYVLTDPMMGIGTYRALIAEGYPRTYTFRSPLPYLNDGSTATLHMASIDKDGNYVLDDQPFYIKADATASINTPAAETAEIEVSGSLLTASSPAGVTLLQLHSSTGVMIAGIYGSNDSRAVTIDLSDLPAGLYIATARTANGLTVTRKITWSNR